MGIVTFTILGIPMFFIIIISRKLKAGESLSRLYNVIKDTIILTFNKGYFTATDRRINFVKNNLEHHIRIRINSKKFIDKWFIWNSNRLKKIITDYELKNSTQ